MIIVVNNKAKQKQILWLHSTQWRENRPAGCTRQRREVGDHCQPHSRDYTAGRLLVHLCSCDEGGHQQYGICNSQVALSTTDIAAYYLAWSKSMYKALSARRTRSDCGRWHRSDLGLVFRYGLSSLGQHLRRGGGGESRETAHSPMCPPQSLGLQILRWMQAFLPYFLVHPSMKKGFFQVENVTQSRKTMKTFLRCISLQLPQCCQCIR